MRQTQSNRAAGVYIADNSGRPDPDFPDDVLLEIKLPEVIDVSPWELILPADRRADYGEWVVPSVILNKHAKLRLISKEEWNQLWAHHKEARVEQTAEIHRELVAEGLLEHAKDAHGQLLYRNGQPVWRITPKGRHSVETRPEGLL
jgi:hypothetical protein